MGVARWALFFFVLVFVLCNLSFWFIFFPKSSGKHVVHPVVDHMSVTMEKLQQENEIDSGSVLAIQELLQTISKEKTQSNIPNKPSQNSKTGSKFVDRIRDENSLDRSFHTTKETMKEASKHVDNILKNRIPSISSGNMFSQCFINTLETTTTLHLASSLVLENQNYRQELETEYMDKFPFRTHVITGDIAAMWLRDSMGQFRPYLFGAHPSLQEKRVTSLVAKSILMAEDNEASMPFTKEEEKDLLQLYNGWVSADKGVVNETTEYMRLIIEGLIRRQAELIGVTDPLANAFRLTVWNRPLKAFEVSQGKGGIIAERKYELDSLCSYLQLASGFFSQLHPPDISFECLPQDAMFIDPIFLLSLRNVLSVVETLQKPSNSVQFLFADATNSSSLYKHPVSMVNTYHHPDLPESKWASIPFTGLSASGFRPSDDLCDFPFHIPSNMFAVATLSSIKGMLESVLQHNTCFTLRDTKEVQILLDRIVSLRKQIDDGIKNHAVYNHEEYGEIYCYEVDGKGNCKLMDDANVPSLLAIPHYGYEGIDSDSTTAKQLYENTRAFLLSTSNLFFVEFPATHRKAPYCNGAIGSPHTKKGSVWPMSMIMQATTRIHQLVETLELHSESIEDSFVSFVSFHEKPAPSKWLQDVVEAKEEILSLLEILKETTGQTNFMHESFSASPFQPSLYTRSWFAWANSLYAESVISSFPLFFPELFQ